MCTTRRPTPGLLLRRRHGQGLRTQRGATRRSEDIVSLTTGRGPLSATPAGRFNKDVPPGLVYVEPFPRRVRGISAGKTVLDSERVLLVHRPAQPPTYAFPPDDVTGVRSDVEPEADGYVGWSGARWAPGSRRRSRCSRTPGTPTIGSTALRPPADCASGWVRSWSWTPPRPSGCTRPALRLVSMSTAGSSSRTS